MSNPGITLGYSPCERTVPTLKLNYSHRSGLFRIFLTVPNLDTGRLDGPKGSKNVQKRAAREVQTVQKRAEREYKHPREDHTRRYNTHGRTIPGGITL